MSKLNGVQAYGTESKSSRLCAGTVIKLREIETPAVGKSGKKSGKKSHYLEEHYDFHDECIEGMRAKAVRMNKVDELCKGDAILYAEKD